LLDAPYISTAAQSRLGSFMYHNNDQTDTGNPSNAAHFYGYLNAKWKNGEHLTKGEDGTNPDNPITNFFYPDNPADSTAGAWSECSIKNQPEDRRFLISSKPFDLPKGETVTLEYAVVTSFDVTYPCPDISTLREQVGFVQTYYNRNIKKPIVLSTTGVNNKFTTIYPNPVTNQLQIISTSNFISLSMYNTAGQVVINGVKVNGNTFQFDRSKILSGMYTLKLIDTTSKISSAKILLQ